MGRRPSWREPRVRAETTRPPGSRRRRSGPRSASASFLVAASVLARMGDAQLGAHQIAYQLFILIALILDALAIAGQVIVGRSLGAGDADGAYAAGVRMIGWSVVVGLFFAIALAPL